MPSGEKQTICKTYTGRMFRYSDGGLPVLPLGQAGSGSRGRQVAAGFITNNGDIS
jgi:hypothetical protein